MTTMSQSTGAAAAAPVRKSRWVPLAVLLSGPFVYVLDFFIINVALPDIQRGLSASAAAVEWIVAGYALTSAALMVTGGRLGDHYGRRRMFTAGIALFAVASALCALAPGAGFLIGARLAQGASAAVMASNVLSIIGVTYAGRDRVRAITAYGIVMGLAAAGGQLIGGALIAANIAGLGWRAIFWVNVPVGVAAALAAGRLIPESRAADRGRLDLTGVVLLTLALVSIVLPLVTGRQEGWPAWAWACLAAGPVLLAAFGLWLRFLRAARAQGDGGLRPGAVRRARWVVPPGAEPLLDPAVFASRPLRAGLTVQVLFWCQQAASYLMIALYLQQGRGLSPVASGEAFSVLAVGYLATSLPAPALTVRFGRAVLAAGALVAAAGDGLLLLAAWHWGTGGPLAAVLPGLAILGAGQGLCITPLTTTVLAHATPQAAGSVAGALSTAQQVGNAIGVAVTGVIFYGLVSRGYRGAFGWSVAEMGVLLLAVALVTLILLRPQARPAHDDKRKA